MPLDATVGGASSNSFLTVARADVLASEHPFADAWLDLDATTEKPPRLIMASRLINYRLCYVFDPASPTQALKFPVVGSTVIPIQIELATFELALMLATSNVTTELDQVVQGLRRLKADTVELEFKENIPFRTIPENVMAFIPASWLCSTKPEILFDVI